MKNVRLASMITLTLVLLAAQLAFAAAPAYAAPYTHKVTVSSGNGSFSGDIDYVDNGAASASVNSNSASVTIGGTEYELEEMPDGNAPDDSKYFVRGLKVAGDDNDNAIVGTIDVTTGQGHVGEEDVELVIAYGLKSNMVTYTVNYYLAGSTTEIADSETHYGVIGDKPVVSYKHIEGYLPQTLNITGTIAENGTTEFNFYYNMVDANGNIIIINRGGNGGTNGGGANGGGAGGGTTGDNGAGGEGGDNGAGTTNIADNNTPTAENPTDITDIDSGDTPTTDPAEIDDTETPGTNWALIGGGAAIVVAIAAAVLALARRKREENDEA